MTDDAFVFVVDDDEAIRRSLELLIGAVGHDVKSFPDAAAFLDFFTSDLRGCIVADLRMPGMTGLEMQEKLVELGSTLPIIFLSAHGDVPAAVRALKKGATDFLEKPFNPTVLLERIDQALTSESVKRRKSEKALELVQRMEALTPREKEIMTMVADGKSSKVIAIELAISERTVELHRFRIMKKMSARSVADLVRMLATARP
ncbi:MAG: response regulator [Acidiferrobacterales bacterium]|nr:response regulator [Acidiferrobacterales bacterium]